jgi:hypothetical protein
MAKIQKAAKRWIHSNPKAWKQLESVLKDNDVAGRTPSAAFLIWFLQDVYRLEAVEAHDAVCDRKLDKRHRSDLKFSKAMTRIDTAIKSTRSNS